MHLLEDGGGTVARVEGAFHWCILIVFSGMANEKSSTWAWITVHLVYPLLPVPIEGLLRLAVGNGKVDYDTFSAATLAISAGLLSVFVNQSLRNQDDALADQIETQSRNGACAMFMMFAMIFFVLFGVVVLANALVNGPQFNVNLEPLLHILQVAIFVGWVVPVVSAVVAQRAYKLRASFA